MVGFFGFDFGIRTVEPQSLGQAKLHAHHNPWCR